MAQIWHRQKNRQLSAEYMSRLVWWPGTESNRRRQPFQGLLSTGSLPEDSRAGRPQRWAFRHAADVVTCNHCEGTANANGYGIVSKER